MMFPVVRTNGRNLFSGIDPWTALSRDFGQLFGNADAVSHAMAVDIREEGENLVIVADVPGVAQDDVNVTVEKGALTIGVNRKTTSDETKENYFIRERNVSSVARTFHLPDTADLDKVQAELANGVLTLRIPTKEEAKPRQIPVK